MNAHCFQHRCLADAITAAFHSRSALRGDLMSLRGDERNLPSAKARSGPSARARAGHWIGVRGFFITGDPEFKALEKEIRINWLK